MSNINDVPTVMVLLSYFSRNGAWHTDARTDSNVIGLGSSSSKVSQNGLIPLERKIEQITEKNVP